ncbi:hypothetical protein UFOVP1221_20, partial [uncultured Caudovirales phage]
MTKGEQVMAQGVAVESGSDRLTQVFEPQLEPLIGSATPRIHTPLNDLPSRGFELIDFADTIFENGFMPW